MRYLRELIRLFRRNSAPLPGRKKMNAAKQKSLLNIDGPIIRFINSEISFVDGAITPTSEIHSRFRKFIKRNYTRQFALTVDQTIPTSKALTLLLRKLWTAQSLGIPADECPKIFNVTDCPIVRTTCYCGTRHGVQSALVGVSLRQDIY